MQKAFIEGDAQSQALYEFYQILIWESWKQAT